MVVERPLRAAAARSARRCPRRRRRTRRARPASGTSSPWRGRAGQHHGRRRCVRRTHARERAGDARPQRDGAAARPVAGHDELVARSAGGRAPRGSAVASRLRTPPWVSCRSDRLEPRPVSTSNARPVPVDLQVVHAGRARSPSRRCAVSPSIEVRVRWRSSASVPVSTVRPGADDAHPVAQRLDLGEDVAGQQDGSPAARAPRGCSPGTRPPSAGRARRSARRGSAARRRRRAPRPAPPSAGCPSSRRGPSCVGSSSKRSSSSSRRRRVEPAAQPAEQVDDLAAGQVRPQVTSPGT